MIANACIETKLLWRINENPADQGPFCQVELILNGYLLRDPDGWAIGSLMKGSIDDLVRRLTLQENIRQNTMDHFHTLSSQDLFLHLYEWQWEKG